MPLPPPHQINGAVPLTDGGLGTWKLIISSGSLKGGIALKFQGSTHWASNSNLTIHFSLLIRYNLTSPSFNFHIYNRRFIKHTFIKGLFFIKKNYCLHLILEIPIQLVGASARTLGILNYSQVIIMCRKEKGDGGGGGDNFTDSLGLY